MAATTLGKLKEGIREKLSILTVRVKLETAVGHMDINHEAEDFYCGLLNTAFGWELSNLNALQMNFPAIDLADRKNRTAVQVTSTEGRKKVQDTLDKFFEKKLDKDYDRLIVLIIGEKPNYRGAFAMDGELDFDKDEDIWDTGLLIKKLEGIPQSRLLAVDDYLNQQLPERQNRIVSQESPEMLAALTGIQKAVETMAEKPRLQRTTPQWKGKINWKAALITCALVLLLGGIVLWWLNNHRRYHDGMLMRNAFESAETEQEEFAFNTQAKRKEVATITFLNYIDPEVENTVDASAMQNGTVRAWAVPNGHYYDLYIAAEGGVYAPEDSAGLFREMINLSTIRFNNSFNTSRTENMYGMFLNCANLLKLDVSGFQTENVTNMGSMFSGCQKLTELNLKNMDTSNVTNMYAMFYQLDSIAKLDVSGFDTANVTDMGYMFSRCQKLTELDVTNLNTANVTNMEHMFSQMGSLTALNLQGFTTSNVTKMYAMFYQTKMLRELDLSSFDTRKVTDMAHMFQGCGSLFQLDLSSFDTANVVTMKCMFHSCEDLFRLDVSSFDTGNVVDMSFMFNECIGLSKLDVSNFNTSNVTDMRKMFAGCPVSELDVSNFKTMWVEDMSGMFDTCVFLLKLDLSSFHTSRVKNMANMFNMCASLQEINLSSFNTSSVTDMSQMFSHCWGLTSMELRGFDTANVTDMSGMFENCINLHELDLGKWDVTSVMVYDSFMDEGKTVNGQPWEKLFQ